MVDVDETSQQIRNSASMDRQTRFYGPFGEREESPEPLRPDPMDNAFEHLRREIADINQTWSRQNKNGDSRGDEPEPARAPRAKRRRAEVCMCLCVCARARASARACACASVFTCVLHVCLYTCKHK